MSTFRMFALSFNSDRSFPDSLKYFNIYRMLRNSVYKIKGWVEKTKTNIFLLIHPWS